MKDLNPPDYDFVWTVDGEDWNGELFDSLDELRDFAGDLVSANEGNPAFKFYGRRFEVMDACDMLDRGIRPERVRLARFEEGNEGAEPVLSGKRRDFVAKRLIRLIDECAGYGGNLDEMAHAAADATRALIELERA